MYFQRYLYNLIDWNVRMLCILGARGVGKTTMMLQYIKSNNLQASHAIYCSLATYMKRLFVILSRMVPFTLTLTDLGRQIEASRQTVLPMLHAIYAVYST